MVTATKQIHKSLGQEKSKPAQSEQPKYTTHETQSSVIKTHITDRETGKSIGYYYYFDGQFQTCPAFTSPSHAKTFEQPGDAFDHLVKTWEQYGDGLEVYADAGSPNSYSVYSYLTGGFHRVIVRDGEFAMSNPWQPAIDAVKSALLDQRPIYTLPSYVKTDDGLITCDYTAFGFSYSVKLGHQFVGLITHQATHWRASLELYHGVPQSFGSFQDWREAVKAMTRAYVSERRRQERLQSAHRNAVLARYMD